jgi:DnaA-homolog protein
MQLRIRGARPEPVMRQLPLGVRWRDGSVFDTYVPGPNDVAVRALHGVGSGGGPPTWLWGAPSTGKTHLLQASCALTGASGGTAAYFPMNQREKFEPAALSGCEQLDLVCIDDVQCIAGDGEWERALFVLHNGIQENNHRLLLAATMAPASIEWLLPDLGSRMNASLVFQLRTLSEEEQIEALRVRARKRGLDLPEEAATYLLRRLPRDLRSLCDLLEKLDTASLAANRRLTIPFIRHVLEQRQVL